MEDYKIYKYTNKINNKVYIGQTRQSVQHRAMGKGWGYKKCPHFFSAIKKYGWENFNCEILHDKLDRESADVLEKKYISYFKSLNLSYNIDDGGKSKGKHKISSDIKKRISNSMKGKNKGIKNGMYGKSVNNKTVYVFDNQQNVINTFKSVKECAKSLKLKQSNLGHYLINYTLKIGDDLYSDTNTIKKPIKIYKPLAVGLSQYDLNGNLIKHYNNTIDVKKEGLVNDSLLRCHRNKPWKYKNHIWVFDDIDVNKEDIINASSTIKMYKPRIIGSQLKDMNIYQYDLYGNFIKQYNCFADAIKNSNITYNSLKRLHLGSWAANDYIWSSSNNVDKNTLIIEAYTNINKYTAKNPMFQFDLDGKLIRAFISQSELKKLYKLSRDTIMKYICNGPFIYKGFIWSDLDNLYPLNTIKDRSINNISKVK